MRINTENLTAYLLLELGRAGYAIQINGDTVNIEKQRVDA